MTQVVAWFRDNPTIAVVIVVCVTLLLALAMWLGLDMSWLPKLIDKVTG
jgi:hypothetical protein